MSAALPLLDMSSLDMDALAAWVLQTGLWVGALLGLVLVLRRPFARRFGAPATYALWAIPAIRLVMPPLTLPRSVLPERFRAAVEPAPAPPALPASPDTDAPLAWFDLPLPAASGPTLDYAMIALTIWAGGAVLMLGWQLARQGRFLATLSAHSDPMPEHLAPLADAAREAAGLRRLPRLRLHKGGLGPCVTGLLRPVVLLPSDVSERFTDEQIVIALLHEFVHVRRQDLPAALLALVVRALNWPNPLAHVAARAFRADQESACDAAVLKRLPHRPEQAATYAQTLLRAAKSRPHAPIALAAR